MVPSQQQRSADDGAGQPGRDTVVAAWREEGRWYAALLPDRLAADLDGLVAALRAQPGEGGSLGLVDLDGDCFVAVRVRGARVDLLLSDAGAAYDLELAEQVVDELDLSDDDLDEADTAGDLDIFADLGLDARELEAIIGEGEAYADEMLAAVAQRLGFGQTYTHVVEAARR